MLSPLFIQQLKLSGDTPDSAWGGWRSLLSLLLSSVWTDHPLTVSHSILLRLEGEIGSRVASVQPLMGKWRNKTEISGAWEHTECSSWHTGRNTWTLSTLVLTLFLSAHISSIQRPHEAWDLITPILAFSKDWEWEDLSSSPSFSLYFLCDLGILA